MKRFALISCAFPAILLTAGVGSDAAQAITLNFSVLRNGAPIGTSLIRVQREGERTVANTTTHIRVKFAFLTVYRFDQRETERFDDGRFVAMTAATDDNGTIHRVSAARRGKSLAVDADGRVSEVDPAAVPISLWDPSFVRRKIALNPSDGKVTPISVVDRGEDRLVLHGHPVSAHHYRIETNFAQDVWYDAQQRLVRVALRGTDGSTIEYRPG